MKFYTTSKTLFYLGLPFLKILAYFFIAEFVYSQAMAFGMNFPPKTFTFLGLTITPEIQNAIANTMVIGIIIILPVFLIVAVGIVFSAMVEINDIGNITIRFPSSQKKTRSYDKNNCMGFRIVRTLPFTHTIELISEYGHVPLFPYFFEKKKFEALIQTLKNSCNLQDYTAGVPRKIQTRMETAKAKDVDHTESTSSADTYKQMQEHKKGLAIFIMSLLAIIVIVIVAGFGVASVIWNAQK